MGWPLGVATHLIGDSNNGSFLGLLELLSHYDPLLEEHLKKCKIGTKRKAEIASTLLIGRYSK